MMRDCLKEHNVKDDFRYEQFSSGDTITLLPGSKVAATTPL